MLLRHFSTDTLLLLAISTLCFVAATLLFAKRSALSLGLLFIGTLLLGSFVAVLDPFLVLWDEQYHALVAKNLSGNPFRPMLYAQPILEYDYSNWTANHVWLHKQPLFLWQMALSIKLFGTNAFAVRLPSILMHALLPLMVYRMGRLLLTPRVGFYAALFVAVAHFPLEQVAGRYATDHNDVAFLFYVTASFWAWFEHHHQPRKRWLILIGLSAGAAVLVKWLSGILVLPVWFATLFVTSRNARWSIRTYRNLLLPSALCLLVAVPWQVYANHAFPAEYAAERALNTAHLFTAVETHAGNGWYYVTKGLGALYGNGWFVPVVILLGLIRLLTRIRTTQHWWMIALAIVSVYGFFSLAATKMVAYPIIVAPMLLLGIAALTEEALVWAEKRSSRANISGLLGMLLPIGISILLLNLPRTTRLHTDWKPENNFDRAGKLREMAFIRSLPEQLEAQQHVIFNADFTKNGHIPVMFFTNHIAYPGLPSEETLQQLKAIGLPAAVVPRDPLPERLRHNASVRILEIP